MANRTNVELSDSGERMRVEGEDGDVHFSGFVQENEVENDKLNCNV